MPKNNPEGKARREHYQLRPQSIIILSIRLRSAPAEPLILGWRSCLCWWRCNRPTPYGTAQVNINRYENGTGAPDYTSLTDMLKAKGVASLYPTGCEPQHSGVLRIWEQIYKPNFNYDEFAASISQAD